MSNTAKIARPFGLLLSSMRSIVRATRPIKPTLMSVVDDGAIGELITAVGNRQLAGESTSLRQLHKIMEIEQSQALRLASKLVEEGLAELSPAIHDRFESEITLKQPLLRAVRAENRTD
ncbi:hypothetical protein [Altererythrobacter epoxidivorans]|nr:hypothetical protein [Altererythrobacter epoxidivorans]